MNLKRLSRFSKSLRFSRSCSKMDKNVISVVSGLSFMKICIKPEFPWGFQWTETKRKTVKKCGQYINLLNILYKDRVSLFLLILSVSLPDDISHSSPQSFHLIRNPMFFTQSANPLGHQVVVVPRHHGKQTLRKINFKWMLDETSIKSHLSNTLV